MKRTAFSVPALAAVAYAGFLFVVPGFWLVRRAAGAIAASSDRWKDPELIALGLYGAVYFVILAVAIWAARWYNRITRDEPEDHPSIRRALGWLSLRGYRWLSGCAILGLPLAFFGALRWGTAVPESVALFLPVFLAALDLRVWPDPVSWEDALPPPKVGFDSVPHDIGTAACKEVSLTWDPWLWADVEEPAVTEKFKILEAEWQDAARRGREPDLRELVTGGLCSSVIRVAARLRELSEKNGFNALQEAASVIAMVRGIPYATDQETHGVEDYPDYPVELLWYGRGDCEDHGILAAALLHALGHKVGLFEIELQRNAHVALAYQTSDAEGMMSQTGDDGRDYFYVETVPVPESHDVGDIPAEFFAEMKRARVRVIG